MDRTARISNIESTTTENELIAFLESAQLPLDLDQPLSLTSTPERHQVATVTFRDNATLKQALGLPRASKKLKNRFINVDDEFDGFTVLSQGTQIDIVALHGLNGHAFNTWEYRNRRGESFMWLRDSLPERIPGARTLIYGYHADVDSAVQTGRIRTFAETFVERLRHLREDSATQNRPLVLIGYSMGGIIIKQALLIAKTRADNIYKRLLNSIIGIIFLGTPHQGGRLDIATTVANFLHPQKKAREELIQPLEPNSLFLFDQTEDFRQLLDVKRIAISTLFETRRTVISRSPLKPPILVVEEQSAILGIARETKVSVDADHAHLSKFKSSTDGSLETVVQKIKEWDSASMPVISTSPASSQPAPPDELRYICIGRPDQLNDPDYPILKYCQHTYWALSYADKRYAMAILAFDKKGRFVRRWDKNGSRHICRIECNMEERAVYFFGEGNTFVKFSLTELEL